jgi:hypothetical protein
MDLFFALAIMVLGWIFLILSWYMEDFWGSVLVAITSMIFFFASGGMMLYITEPYVYITSLDVIGTGQMHLTQYQPYGLLFNLFGMIAMVWIFIMVFYDAVLPKLREMGVK